MRRSRRRYRTGRQQLPPRWPARVRPDPEYPSAFTVQSMVSQAHLATPTLAVRHVLSTEHIRLRELRLTALERNPEAFGSS